MARLDNSMSLLLNRAKANTTTTGTGTVSLGTAVVPFQSWASAGAVSGYRYSYLIEEGSDWEVGEGVFTSGSPATLTRVLVASSTGSLLTLAGAATVACVAKRNDTPLLVEKVALSGLTNYTFSMLPAEFTSLELVIFGRTAVAATTDTITCQLNGDTAANYARTRAGAVNAATWAIANSITDTAMNLGIMVGGSATAGYPSMLRALFPGYNDTNFHKQALSLTQGATANSAAGYELLNWLATYWRNTAAITSLKIIAAGAFAAGSYATLTALP